LTSPVLNGVIIGCGKIAGGLPLTEVADSICTHAQAYQQHDGFKLVACIEPNVKERKKFMFDWNILYGFTNLDECLSSDLVIDVVSICSSTETHSELLEQLVSTNVAAVFCEKPMGIDINKSKNIVHLYEIANKLLAVNYTRRWNSTLVDFKSRIANGEWGELLSVYGIYSHGIYHFGSHMIDLIRFMLGEIESVNYSESQYESKRNDYLCNAVLKLEHGEPVFLNIIPSDDISIFELQINLSGAVIYLDDFGKKLRIRRFKQDSLKLEKSFLGEEMQIKTSWENALYNAYDNIYHTIVDGEYLTCSGQKALVTESICSDIVG